MVVLSWNRYTQRRLQDAGNSLAAQEQDSARVEKEMGDRVAMQKG